MSYSERLYARRSASHHASHGRPFDIDEDVQPSDRMKVASRSSARSMSRVRCCHTNLIPATRCLEGPLASGRGGGSPRPERFVSEDTKRAAGSEMALDVEDPMESG